MEAGYQDLDKAVAVGRVTPRSARLWLRSPGGGRHRLELLPMGTGSAGTHAFDMGDASAKDHTHAFVFPDDFPGALPLEPVTRYRFRILSEQRGFVGEGQFETTPAKPAQMPSRFAVGVASCHQPFDEDGNLHEQGRRMLRLTRIAWERSEIKHALWVGDQLYIDYPPNQSIFDEEYFRTVGPKGRKNLLECSRDEVLALYHARYRRNWSQPEWQALQSQFPGYPILDDHEVADNYGSMPEHHQERWRHIREAAGAAYRHYQHSRIEPSPADHDGPYDYSLEYGSVPCYVLDIRSMRRSADGNHARVFAPHQLEKFSAWLNANADAPVLFIVCSVPPFFMPGWASRLARRIPGSFREDAHDRWMHPQYRNDRRRMLSLIREHQQLHPLQKVVLVGGDVHVGYVSRCEWRTEPQTALYQFVSSSITHKLSNLDWHFARHIPRTHFMMSDLESKAARIHLLGGRMARIFQQPVGGLNAGVIEVDVSVQPARLNFKLYGEQADNPNEPKCLFESGFE